MKVDIIFANTLEEALNARDRGYEPVECAFGRDSVVGDLCLDHHGMYSQEEAVSIKAARLAKDGVTRHKFVVAGTPDADQMYAAAVLSRNIPIDFKDAEAIAQYDIDLVVSNLEQLYAPAGYPALTVPAGYAEDGTPQDVIFVGGFLSEPQLLAVGYAFEQASQARLTPDLEATLLLIKTIEHD